MRVYPLLPPPPNPTPEVGGHKLLLWVKRWIRQSHTLPETPGLDAGARHSPKAQCLGGWCPMGAWAQGHRGPVCL